MRILDFLGEKKLLVLIVLGAALLRFYAISDTPPSLNWDEVSHGYNAYSILRTGEDEWGERFPAIFRAYGDYKLPGYIYATAVSEAIFGLNAFAVRLPSVLAGIAIVLFVYLLARKLFNENVALLSALLVAVEPWSFFVSRGAFEANLGLSFIVSGVYFLLTGLKKEKYLPLSALLLGLSVWTYNSARVFVPLLLAVLVVLYKKELLGVWEKNRRIFALCFLLFALFLIPMFWQLLSPVGQARYGAVAIIDEGAIAQINDSRVTSDLPTWAARLRYNKATYFASRAAANWFSHFSPQFLFTQGAGEWTYGMIPGRGVLYLFELPFILAALWYLARRRAGTGLKVILLWLLLAPAPAALAKGPGFAANRAAVMMPAVQILSAFGAVVLWDLARKWPKNLKAAGLLGYGVLAVISLVFFLEDYRYHAPINGAPSMLYGRREAVEFTRSVEQNYGEIVFSRSLSEPQIYVAFYGKWDPADYQRQAQDWLRYEEEGRSFVDQLGEYRLGKYTFRSINRQNDLNLQGVLLVAKPNEFPQDVVAAKKVNYPNGEPALLIVDPAAQIYAKTF